MRCDAETSRSLWTQTDSDTSSPHRGVVCLQIAGPLAVYFSQDGSQMTVIHVHADAVTW